MNKDEQLLNKLKQVVLNNFENEHFSVQELSELAAISRSQLHRKLKRLKGQSISQFIREIRLEEALELLQQDAATTSEIAYKVGFNSSSYFHKCFLNFYGYPPSEAKHIYSKKQQHETKRNEVESKSIFEPSVIDKQSIKHLTNRKKRASLIKFTALAILVFLISLTAIYVINHNRSTSPKEKSIAVLPFKNLSTDAQNQHFADGLVEDLLNRLSLVPEFKVISRTSSDTYRHRDPDKKVSDIASELNVSYVIEGSIQKHENKARITVQLIDAKQDDHLWTKTFDEDFKDVFKIQSAIAIEVASGLSTILTKKQALNIKKNQTDNVKAFELYQLGRYYWGKRVYNEYATAINYFEQAIAEDPNYALAYAGLADTHFLMIWYTEDYEKMITLRNKAEALALKALKLDPNLVEAYTVLATLYFFIDWEWEKAENMFLHALRFNKNYSTLHHRYSEHLSTTGRHLEARNHINKALELDPLSFIVREVSAKLYLNRGEFDKALSESHLAGELNKIHETPQWYKFFICLKKNDDRLVLKSLRELAEMNDIAYTPKTLDSIYNTSGRNGLLQWAVDSTGDLLRKAHCYVFAGKYNEALDYLETAYANGSRMEDVPYWYPSEKLHEMPRFIALMKKMNLPWKPDSHLEH
ncbi:helix-turn-helix domain-containing protein [Hwangdonia sp.]|uniref:helix-turn-helix domain-containing protein n=1 Tax=Hwangdonia sp. TaxID=1883432 RepID=UPI003AB475E2